VERSVNHTARMMSCSAFCALSNTYLNCRNMKDGKEGRLNRMTLARKNTNKRDTKRLRDK
jgi:hypothetical protein